MYGESSTVESASSGGRPTDIATTSGRATMTSAASLSAKSKTLSIIWLLVLLDLALFGRAGEQHPQLRFGVAVVRIPGGVCPSTCSTPSVDICSTQMIGLADGEERAHRRGEPTAPSPPDG